MNETRTMKLPFRLLLSKWFFVVYFGLGLVCFSSIPWSISWIGAPKSFFLTFALMTGSDPYSFKEIIEPHGFIWMIAWLIHLASWLLIPALIALVITEAKEDIKKDEDLRVALREWLRIAGVQGDLDERAKAMFTTIDTQMNELANKGAKHD